MYLPRSKGDRENLGQTYQAPALLKLCPVQAYIDWITEAALVRGPVFRSIDRWGNLSEEGLHANSIIPSAAPGVGACRHCRRKLHQPLAASRLCHVGPSKWLGSEVVDELRRLEGYEVRDALC